MLFYCEDDDTDLLGYCNWEEIKKNNNNKLQKKKELTQRSGLTRIYLFVFRSAQQIIKKGQKI